MTMLWLDGRLLPAAEARIATNDRGFTLGDGIFETIKARNGRPLRWTRHLARLEAGAATLGIPVGWPGDTLKAAMESVLAANGLDAAVLRLTLSRGPGERGLLPPDRATPTLLIAANPLPPPAKPARAVIAETVRRNAHSPLARIKSLSYLDSVLARMEAARRGADDALLLNGAGRLAEATAANLFLAIGDRLHTPPVAEGALPGTMRAELLAMAPVEERPIDAAALEKASELFLSSSLGLRPVASVEGRAIGTGEPGPAFRRLQAEIEERERRG